MFKFECHHCQQHISADSSQSGMSAECPACGSVFVVPEPPEESDGTIAVEHHSPEPAEPYGEDAGSTIQQAAPRHSFGERVKDGSEAMKKGAHILKEGTKVGWSGLKRRSKQAALRAQIEKLRNIDLRKAYHSLGQIAFELEILSGELSEHFHAIQDLDTKIAGLREKGTAEEGETKMATLKRVSKNTAKAGQAQALTVKREHSITELGRAVHTHKDQINAQDLNEKIATITSIERQIQEIEEQIRALDDGGKSKFQTLAVAATIILLLVGSGFLIKKTKMNNRIAKENVSRSDPSKNPISDALLTKEQYNDPNELERDIDKIREKIGNSIRFIVVQKLDREKFPELGARGELYEINVPSEYGTVPPSKAILITRETTFKSTGESSMWVLARKAVEVKMQSGFTEEIYVVEESPNSLVKEWYRLVKLKSKFNQAEETQKAIEYLKKNALDHLDLPKLYLSNALRNRNFSASLDSSEQDKLIKLAKNQEWPSLLKELSYNDSVSMNEIKSKLDSLRHSRLTAKIKSSSSHIESSFPAGSAPRVNIGYIVIPPASSRIFSTSERGIIENIHIQNLNEETKSNEASVQLDFWGSSVYLYEITGGSSAYRHKIYSENYKPISEEIEKTNKLFKLGNISKSSLDEIAKKLESYVREGFVQKILNNY